MFGSSEGVIPKTGDKAPAWNEFYRHQNWSGVLQPDLLLFSKALKSSGEKMLETFS